MTVGSPDKRERNESEIESMINGMRSRKGSKSPMDDSKYGTMISSVITSSPERVSAKLR